MTTSKHIYFAAPLFAKSDLLYNQYLVEKIRTISTDLTIYLPQENDGINDKSAYADSKMIALADTEEVLRSDLMVALLDGLTIDAGVASEIGVAYAKGIPVIALYTDSRQQGADNQKKIDALQTPAENQFHYLNLYTVGLIKLNGTIVNTEEALLEQIKSFLEGSDFHDL
ncbi:nucleoside 2-deoxyribosyltransferase [Enterococcus sp. AZ135]|uniref:nucleoside 2-deoxyribosyltransferase n=1 Tax=unclassified Enterococcus TaxID=2608891 RepID=UPI003F1E512E